MVFGVSADSDRAAYERFLKNQNIVFPTYRDPSLKVNLSQIALTYGTAMYPETYIIGRDGKIARKVVGAQQRDSPDLIAYLDTRLGQNSSISPPLFLLATHLMRVYTLAWFILFGG